jgi:PX domain-containing protein kinase-like protein
MTLLSVSPEHCIALQEEFSASSEENSGVLMELLGQINHPYIYPILDLNFFHTSNLTFACLVMPFNNRGSLKDLIYKVSSLEIPGLNKYKFRFSGSME